MPEHQVLECTGYYEFHGMQKGPGDAACIAFHITRLEHLVHPAEAWARDPIGNGILIDQRLCFGICGHDGHSGVNVYSGGGLDTFDSQSAPGWVQLEVACCNTTKLKKGRGHTYCIQGPGFQVCQQAVLLARWVPMVELPNIVWLN